MVSRGSSGAIHPTAIVGEKVDLAADVIVEPYAIIDDGATVGAGTRVGAHAVIRKHARIGKNVRIFPGAVIGEDSQDKSFDPAIQDTYAIVGDGTTVRECVTINRAVKPGTATRVGERVLLMAYSHLGHDVTIGDDVILANAVQLGGHASVGTRAVIGGGTVVHQFARIGEVAMVAGGIGVDLDVPPYTLASAYPAKAFCLNLIGIRRAGFSAEAIRAIDRAFYLFYKAGKPRKEALDEIERTLGQFPEVRRFVEFCRTSKRGVCRLIRGARRAEEA